MDFAIILTVKQQSKFIAPQNFFGKLQDLLYANFES